ncbi:MAG TPA: class I SAM-dependent methyltransferase [Stellaceae bacterium]|jgi:SAM-dependent methyltransferase
MAIAGAVEAWDRRWATAEGRADWLEPEPEVRNVVPALKTRGAAAVLDLGCGVGRHALFLAEAGFPVDAIDGSPVGIAEAGRSAAARGLKINLREAPADSLPFGDGTFDYVLSWNVIYHGNQGDVGRRLAEIWRVLKPGGLYQGTMLPTRNSNYGLGRRIAPDTFVNDAIEERAHPHFYCDATGVVALLAGFELLSLTQREHKKPGSWHWHILAERLTG